MILSRRYNRSPKKRPQIDSDTEHGKWKIDQFAEHLARLSELPQYLPTMDEWPDDGIPREVLEAHDATIELEYWD